MKTVYKLFLATLFIGLASCNYLDIIPAERANDADAFKDPDAAKRYLYSCYSYLPNPRNGVESLDFMTGDEVVTAFEHETFAHFPKGGYTAANPRISYWNTLFQGIRQCYILKNNVDNVPRLDAKLAADYKAQADFLIGYYHFLLIRCYGPTILVKEEPKIDTSPEKYLGRSHLDSCVNFAVKCFDDAIAQFEANDIEDVRLDEKFGLATSIIAKAMKAKLLLYVASPLFNGTKNVSPIFGEQGWDPNNKIAKLMPSEYSSKRWERARDAVKDAIDAAKNKYALYYNKGRLSSIHPNDPTQRTLRYVLCDRENLVKNSELIWADGRGEGAYGLQKKSIPYWNNGAWNGVAPTEAMLNRFYTDNGLPLDHDKTIEDPLDLYAAGRISNPAWGKVSSSVPNTVKIALNREPRFYAWVAFQNGYYEVMGNYTDKLTANQMPYHKDNKAPILELGETPDNAGRLVTQFFATQACGRGSGGDRRTTNYSLTGFLNKKGVHPECTASAGAGDPPFYHWPLMRLADLYLMYAETSVECGDLAIAQQYVDSVRLRAGLPKLQDAYAPGTMVKDAFVNYHETQDGMRDIVRRERMVELYLENQNFWDMRRWLLAGDKIGSWGELTKGYFNRDHYGCDIDAINQIRDFSKRTKTPVIRKFISPTNYLLPIPDGEINKNLQLVQNPGY